MIQDKRLEAHMIKPLRELMACELKLDIISEEFSAGYGIADLVGAKVCKRTAEYRNNIVDTDTLTHQLLVKVLFSIRSKGRTSIQLILKKVAISESTLRTRVLPKLDSMGIIERFPGGFVQMRYSIPNPMREIVAIEAKQTKWRDAILQARRYTFFANKSYIAVWNGTARLVDRNLLYRHRLGLIVVEPSNAEILVDAPIRSPRKPEMHRYCSEVLYDKLLTEKQL